MYFVTLVYIRSMFMNVLEIRDDVRMYIYMFTNVYMYIQLTIITKLNTLCRPVLSYGW